MKMPYDVSCLICEAKSYTRNRYKRYRLNFFEKFCLAYIDKLSDIMGGSTGETTTLSVTIGLLFSLLPIMTAIMFKSCKNNIGFIISLVSLISLLLFVAITIISYFIDKKVDDKMYG